jgi:5-methylcytosine-specific restriction enzyme B
LSTLDLSSPEALKQLASEYAGLVEDPAHYYREWCERLVHHLAAVEKSSLEERSTRAFQKTLWDEDIIAATGQGSINVERALDDEQFRSWLAARSMEPIPANEDARTAHLRQLYNELKDRVRPFATRIPRLKIFRVLAAFYPRAFTTVADATRLDRLHRAMLPGERVDEVARHGAVLRRLEEVLGPVPPDLRQWVVRMTLPWRLVEALEASGTTVSPPPGAASPPRALQPLSASRRRRGMTAMKGYYDTVIRVLDYVGEGMSREDLFSFIKQENPALKATSVNVNIGVLRSELGVLDRSGDLLVPSPQGRRLLEQDDPSVLAPWLLTSILGVDHALVHLRDEGPLPVGELLRFIQAANPGWTSMFAPQAILSWLRSFGVIETNDEARVELTERGKEWASLIHWAPENLRVEEDSDEVFLAPPPPSSGAEPLVVPSLESVLSGLPDNLRYAREQVSTLHAGLWAHARRHFAILTGLSGSGKTSLARSYARSFIQATARPADPANRLLTVAISPGWTDPSALLGYINPLGSDEYVATPFVHFLVSCAAHPSVVHFVVLDEMNLSHPEQYLAPILSGMELDDEPIVLHHESTVLDGIPPRLERFPPNLVIIGTVNMDETTHGVSDKVLDRAFTIEFWNIDLESYPGWGKRGLPAAHEARIRAVLSDLMATLAPVRLHFGWRIIDDVLSFVKRTQEDGSLEIEAALDWVIYSKILPKLRGYDSPHFRTAFAQCETELAKHGLARSRDKLAELSRDLQATGSARFWR